MCRDTMVGVMNSGSSGQHSIIAGRSGIRYMYFTLPAVLLFCFHLGLYKAKQFKQFKQFESSLGSQDEKFVKGTVYESCFD